MLNPVLTFDFGDDRDVGIVLVEDASNCLHVAGPTHERRCDVSDVVLDREQDVFTILGSDVGKGDAQVWNVDALAITEPTAAGDFAAHATRQDLANPQLDDTVVQKDATARFDFFA